MTFDAAALAQERVKDCRCLDCITVALTAAYAAGVAAERLAAENDRQQYAALTAALEAHHHPLVWVGGLGNPPRCAVCILPQDLDTPHQHGSGCIHTYPDCGEGA